MENPSATAGTVDLPGRERLQELVDRGLLTAKQLDVAIAEQKRTRKSLVRIFLDLDLVSEDRLPELLARWKGLPFVDLHEESIDQAAVALVPSSIAKRHTLIPVGFEDETLVVAVADPMNIIVIDDLRIMTDRDVKVVVASKADIEEALTRLDSLDRSAETLLEEVAELEDDASQAELQRVVEEAPVVKAVNRIITQAVQARASDIHVEPEETGVRVRYRIDGVLHEVHQLPKSQQSGVISRLKVMADANIAEKRIPQDGRVSVNIEGKAVDLRVSTLPVAWGEEVAIRILDRSSSLLSLEDLGISTDGLKRYVQSARKSYGAVLLTGPTGSGKSTTLYSTLNLLNEPSKKIITVEDPIEYKLPGLRQMQVHPYIGLTFASALRSILRSDPDMIMVGEIRDQETATIAIHAAMTGHLVLSTLHTNDSPTAATRLVEMGVEPFLVSSALECVMAQRLARVLCPRCAESYKPDRAVLEQVGFPLDSKAVPELKRAVGCRFCSDTGYRGRVAITEVMVVSEQIEQAIAQRRSSDDLKRMAVEEGMRTLIEDGMEKVREGKTTIEEVLRVVI